MGFSCIQKCTATHRYLGYSIIYDLTNEYLKIYGRTARECVEYFCAYVIEFFAKVYLRKPTRRDIKRLYATHEAKHAWSTRIDM